MSIRENFRKRINLLFILILAGSGFLVARLYFVQIVHGEEYRSRAERQYSRPNDRMFERGVIYSSYKDGRTGLAATSLSGFILAMDPGKIEDAEKTFAALHAVVPTLEKAAFMTKVAKKDDPYEELARRLPQETVDTIETLDLDGISMYREKWRYYPGESAAAHAVGFVGFGEDGTQKVGLYGLERSYDDVLSRTASLDVNFFAELFASVGDAFAHKRAAGDLVTSIEPNVELELEKTLNKIQGKWDSKLTGGIIMDPKTGAIYAMGAVPTFNLNEYEKEKSAAVFGNPLISNNYEMGSIIKPLTVAAGLDAKSITAKTTYNDQGWIELDGYTIHNFDGKGRGIVPMQEVLNQSLNTGVSFIVKKMGTEKFATYMKKFGIGEETGIDLPGEARGLIDNLESPRMVEYATASFGQGIAMTPIETIRALAALGNGGMLPTPHVGKEIQYQTGYTKEVSFPEGTQVITKETSEEITRMLVEVVDKALLNGSAKLPHHSVAAKTGTAQIARVDGRGYYDDRYLHSFFGYFPAYEPRFIVFLYTVEPKGVRYASETLAMPFHELSKFLISYYEVPPDR